MSWPETRIESWSDLSSWADGIVSADVPFATRFLFRGQACEEWRLTTSLGRLIDDTHVDEAIDIERSARDRFEQRAHLYVDGRMLAGALDYPDWLALMQHHHAPTRLLDWTESLWVAAYFAVESNWNSDGAIWWFNPATVIEDMEKRFGPDAGTGDLRLAVFVDPNAPKRLRLFIPHQPSERMIA